MEEPNQNAAQQTWSLAMLEQIQTTAQKIHQTFWASNFATQRDLGTGSLEPLLPSSAQSGTGEQRKDQRLSGAVPIAKAIVILFIVMAPLFTVFFSWAILLGVGLDPLAFGMLSFYLVMALLGVIMLVCESHFLKQHKSAKSVLSQIFADYSI
jgi:hypothetical protein